MTINTPHLFYFIPVLLLFSCGNITEKPDTENKPQETVEDSIPYQQNDFVAHSKNFKLLQGTWQSLDDPKSKILFEGNLKIDIYDDIVSGEKYQFTVADKCTNTSAKAKRTEKDRYLVISEFDQCFYISKLENDTLGLSLLGRGNTLRFRRIEE